jgi:hypothetical protein
LHDFLFYDFETLGAAFSMPLSTFSARFGLYNVDITTAANASSVGDEQASINYEINNTDGTTIQPISPVSSSTVEASPSKICKKLVSNALYWL